MNDRPLLVGVLFMLAISLGIGGYLWSLRARAKSQPEAAVAQTVAPPASGAPKDVTLYLAYDDLGVLLTHRARIPLPEDPQLRALQLMRTLVTTYTDKASPHPMGAGSDVRDVYFVGPGLAVIDVNSEFANLHRSGILVEELTIASLVQTLSVNVPAISRVKFLVDGKERDTLAGHADLSGTFDVAGVDQMAKALQSSE